MSDIRDDIQHFFNTLGFTPYQGIILILVFIAIVSISFSTGYWWGHEQVDEAMVRATYSYCTDQNRVGCEQQCCDFEELIRERCPYLAEFQ